ncbi:MAG: methyltransferase domain-containing protein [Proteobacteria bacterium]|nr:methyltransferase domain-containing protein [Pseudomonadota bacterium]
MNVRIDQPAQVGEYDEGMQTMLQLVWGDGFLSPGGPEEVARILEGEDIRGARILDVGSGLGAVDVLLSRDHGAASVVGIDLEPELVARARERAARSGVGDRVSFQAVAPGPMPFADGTFDVVFSKDSLVQIPSKAEIFAEVRRVLVPGGRFIAGDWLRGGSGPYSEAMLEYFRLEGITYNLASAPEMAAALEDAGFGEVRLRDRNAWYTALAREELARMEADWLPTMIARLGEPRARHFVANWRQLVRVLESGELRPAHVSARAS